MTENTLSFTMFCPLQNQTGNKNILGALPSNNNLNVSLGFIKSINPYTPSYMKIDANPESVTWLKPPKDTEK